MKLFVSYGRQDEVGVEALVTDLERAGHDTWFDRHITGGQKWWDEILDRIRWCDGFLFALTPDSAASRACRIELSYAVSLGKPIVPVMLVATNVELAPDPIGVTQIIDYSEPSSQSAIALVTALAGTREAPPLPEPLPSAPAAPLTDLGPVREALSAPSLTQAEQEQVLAQLTQRRDELDQAATLRSLLTRFRQRSDVLESVAHSIDALLASLPIDGRPDRSTRVRRPISQRDPDSVDRLRSLITHVRSGNLTPVIGHGLNDSIIGPTRMIALEWSRTFEFPMAKHQHEAMADVAQFVTVMTNIDTLRSSLSHFVLRELRSRYPEVEAAGSSDLGEAMRLACRGNRSADDPYLVLADLPCPIYVNANPWSLLADALTEAGRDPVVEVCHWREDVYEWPTSIFEAEPSYTPSVERPLVFHVFGEVATPDSLVLTQDDFDEFLMAVAENRSIIPPIVQRVLANSAIMLLGFELEERDVKVLMRSLIGQEGSRKLDRFTHVAAQLEFSTEMTSPARAQRYMERYFSKFHQPSIDLFWGTVDEFAADLAELWNATT